MLAQSAFVVQPDVDDDAGLAGVAEEESESLEELVAPPMCEFAAECFALTIPVGSGV
jgi:hypothetical protein